MDKQKQELVQQFISAITKIRRIVHQSSNISLEEKFATILQMQALGFVKDHPKATVGELAQKLHMSSSSIAQLCDRLVSNGWVKREDDPKDRRVTRLSLTDKGSKELKAIKLKHFKKMGQVFSLLDEEDLKEMVRIITILVQKVEKREHE